MTKGRLPKILDWKLFKRSPLDIVVDVGDDSYYLITNAGNSATFMSLRTAGDSKITERITKEFQLQGGE